MLAELFSCSVREIELLAKDGIVVRVGHGRYDAPRSTNNYIRKLREVAAGRQGSDPDADPVKSNIAKRGVETKLLEMKYQRELGNLVERGVVNATWSSIVVTVRAMILGAPTKIGLLLGLDSDQMKTLRQWASETLNEVALDRGFVGDPPAVNGNGAAHIQVNGDASSDASRSIAPP